MIISVGYRVKSQKGILFRKWATRVLKEYLLRGYVINEERTLVTNENYINLINRVDSIDNRLTKLEKESPYFPKTYVIYEDKVFDALEIMDNIISKAKQDIVLIDSYTDGKTLNILKSKEDDVTALVITSDKTKLSQLDVDSFNEEYGGLSLKIDNRYHDRYLIIDNSIFFHLGSSINYLGKRFAQIDKIVDKDLIATLKQRIIDQRN